MRAKSGDWLVVEAPTLTASRREGQITEVRGAGGAPPYRVRWLDTGHEALVFLGSEARVLTPEEHRAAGREAVHYAAHPEAEAER